MIHQKAKPTAIQPENRSFMCQRFVKNMKHVSVTAKRNDAIGCLEVCLAVARDEPGKPLLRHLMC